VLAEDDGIDVIGVYLEGFCDLDGLAFTRAVREAVKRGKAVLCYKAGRTPEGKHATTGHTASLAGDYVVCETCLHEAGAAVAQTFTEFEDLFRIATALHAAPIRGNRIAAVSGAGFEAVGIADNIVGDAYRLALARFAPQTEERVRAVLTSAGLAALVDLKNPMDINPLADDAVHAAIIRALAADPGVDAVVAGLDPLSPATHTRTVDAPEGIAALLPAHLRDCSTPVVMVIDGGALYDPLAAAIEQAGFAVFRSADRAVRSLGVYIDLRLRAGRLRGE
jgi:acyl-CoA synthetase (NDP forming)